jgi:hypothetical protein
MSSRSKSSYVVSTLCEGLYFQGALVLLNSLLRQGFEGTFVVGYRDVERSLLDLGREEVDRYLRGTSHNDLEVRFSEVDPERHLTNHKPFFLRRLLRRAEAPKGLWYIDPDIVIKANWEDLRSWVQFGIAVCEDVNSPVYSRHPRRMQWKEIGNRLGFNEQQDLDVYANGGFIGLNEEVFPILDRWERFVEVMEDEYEVPGAQGNSLKLTGEGLDANAPFWHLDQDCLNAALTCSTYPVSPLGKRGMDFDFGGRWMSHALGSAKPWNTSYVWRMIANGKAPRQVDHLYWENARTPLRAHTARDLRSARLRLRVAGVLNRIL